MSRCLLFFLPLTLLAASPKSIEAGRREVVRSCSRCHPLDVVAVQRLPREEWNDELRKMIRMGARVKNREAVLDYLEKTYGETTPAPAQ